MTSLIHYYADGITYCGVSDPVSVCGTDWKDVTCPQCLMDAPKGPWQQTFNKTPFEAALDYTLDEVRKVMIDRHKKYGPGNILRHGEFGVVVRLGDKYERLDNSRELDFADESTDDTVLDIIGYGLIMAMLRAGAWPGQEVANS